MSIYFFIFLNPLMEIMLPVSLYKKFQHTWRSFKRIGITKISTWRFRLRRSETGRKSFYDGFGGDYDRIPAGIWLLRNCSSWGVGRRTRWMRNTIRCTGSHGAGEHVCGAGTRSPATGKLGVWTFHSQWRETNGG